MLSLPNSLHFPKFKRIGDLTIVRPIYPGDEPIRADENVEPIEIKKKQIPGYVLDWKELDDWKRRKQEAWAKQYHPDKNIPYVPTLPKEYDEWVYGLKFAIPNSYLHEIRRNARRAAEEWSLRRPFDTVIRECCLRPAVSHAYVTFMLVADCIYDEEKQYYDRQCKPARHILPYKFWVYQTGLGLVWRHSLGEMVDWSVKEDDPKSEWVKGCIDWKAAAEKHHQEVCESMHKVWSDSMLPDPVGPSLLE